MVCRVVPQHGSLQGPAVTVTVTLVSKPGLHAIWLKGPTTTTVDVPKYRVGPQIQLTAKHGSESCRHAGGWGRPLAQLATRSSCDCCRDFIVGSPPLPLPGQGYMGGSPVPTKVACQEWQSHAPFPSPCCREAPDQAFKLSRTSPQGNTRGRVGQDVLAQWMEVSPDSWLEKK